MAKLNYLMGNAEGYPLIITTEPSECPGLVIVGIQTAIPLEYCIPPKRTPKKP